ncbi:MAG: NAD-binding protein, partial [Gammaproteobacteria bacterium]
MRQTFIVGCGYVGRYIAREEIERGAKVSALTHSEQSAQELRELGVEPILGDLDDESGFPDLDLGDHTIYYLAPPPPRGELDTRISHFLAHITGARPPRRVVSISTTGVYGDCGGDWVDESRPVNPQVDRAKR